jgi:acyl transferase domain-containing protein
LRSASPAPVALALSAASAAQLRDRARRQARSLVDSSARIALACDRVNGVRHPGPHRLVAIGQSRTDLARQLAACATGRTGAGSIAGVSRGPAEARVVFLFTGIGAECPGMGRDLFASEPVFRRALEQCDAIYRSLTGRKLLSSADPPFGPDCPLEETHFTQPAVFALEYALTALWRSWGVEPAAVLGHSLGEDAAACAAGVISLADALRLVTARAELMSALPEGGAMVAIFADEAEVRRLAAPWRGEVSIAAVNAPDNVVVAGGAAAVDAVVARCASGHLRTRALRVTRAFHSALMDPMLGAFRRVASAARFHQARVPLVSSLTGRWATSRELSDPDYWTRRIRETMRFADGIRMLHEQGFRTFVEIGPHPTLLRLARRSAPGRDAAWIPTMRRDASERDVTLESLAALFVRGIDVRWPRLDRLPLQAGRPPALHAAHPGEAWR